MEGGFSFPSKNKGYRRYFFRKQRILKQKLFLHLKIFKYPIKYHQENSALCFAPILDDSFCF